MEPQNLSIRRFLLILAVGVAVTAACLTAVFCLMTGSGIFALYGVILTAAMFVWGIIFLKFFQRKLTEFTNSLCRTLDGMIDGGERPQADMEAETSLARISHRLERLYNIMQMKRRKASEEKAELQTLVSDISHQTKTPIANLKMINDTMQNRKMPEGKLQEFLQASGCQLDKLDFLIQAMVKTSRLETGVIALEKKQAQFTETLTAALNGILAPMEKKQITLSVDCPGISSARRVSTWSAMSPGTATSLRLPPLAI